MTQIDREQLLLKNMAAIVYAAKKSRPQGVDLDDWVSDITLQVWRKLDTYDPEKGTITTWICTVAFNMNGHHSRHVGAMKRSAHKTRSIHGQRGSSGYMTDEPRDHRGEDTEAIDRRLDLEAAVSSMIYSDQAIVRSIMDGSRDGDFSREKGVSRQRTNTLRERALWRLHRKLWHSGHSPKKGDD